MPDLFNGNKFWEMKQSYLSDNVKVTVMVNAISNQKGDLKINCFLLLILWHRTIPYCFRWGRNFTLHQQHQQYQKLRSSCWHSIFIHKLFYSILFILSSSNFYCLLYFIRTKFALPLNFASREVTSIGTKMAD